MVVAGVLWCFSSPLHDCTGMGWQKGHLAEEDHLRHRVRCREKMQRRDELGWTVFQEPGTGAFNVRHGAGRVEGRGDEGKEGGREGEGERGRESIRWIFMLPTGAVWRTLLSVAAPNKFASLCCRSFSSPRSEREIKGGKRVTRLTLHHEMGEFSYRNCRSTSSGSQHCTWCCQVVNETCECQCSMLSNQEAQF